MLHLTIGHSELPDHREALQDAIEQCRTRLGDTRPGAGILFTSFLDVDHRNDMLRPVLEAFPGIELIGCTTDGELSSSGGFTEESVLLQLFSSPVLAFGSGMASGVGTETSEAARGAVEQAREPLGCEPRCCVTLSDGLNSFTAPVAPSLRSALGPGVPIVGGSAGDGYRVKRTLQFHGDRVLDDGLAVLLFGGELHASSGFASGWRPVGPEYRIGEVDGPCVLRIGEQSSLEFYRAHLGEGPVTITDIAPFSLAAYETENEFYIRAPAAVHPERNAITFAGCLTPGTRVRLTRMTRDDIVAAARSAARDALERYPGPNGPDAVLVFSCTSRRQILGSRTCEEQQALSETFGAQTPFGGFYTYGEICPLGQGRESMFMNSTFVALCIGEG